MKTRLFCIMLLLCLCLLLAACNKAALPIAPSVAPTAPSASPTASQSFVDPQIKSYDEEFEGAKCSVQEFDFDIDGDRNVENVRVYLEKAYIYEDDPLDYEYVRIHVFVTPEGATEHIYMDVYGDQIRDEISFAYFDQSSESLAICIEENGASADPATHVFWYDGYEVQYINVRGFILSYDKAGNIYTDYNYLMSNEQNILYSSFVLGKGLVPYDKNELIGRQISFVQGYPLVNDPTYIIAQVMGSHYADNKDEVIEDLGENFAVFLSANEKAEIVDFYCEKDDEDETQYIVEPWMQLKTADGKLGWIRLVSGD